MTVFEKSRGPGGRTSSRRAEGLRFDHGCPILEDGAAASAFREAGAEMEPFADGVVPVPAMSAGAMALASGLELRTGVEVEAVGGAPGGLELSCGGEPLGVFDRVAVTAPAGTASSCWQ